MTVVDEPAENAPDFSLIDSWIQILSDNSVAVRTGVSDFGQGTVGTVFRQIVAEELKVAVDAITEMATGDTDRTPNGGISAGFMSWEVQKRMIDSELHPGSPFGYQALNMQKVAAYAYGELLERAAKRLGAPREQISASLGRFSSPAGDVTYAELVQESPLGVRLEVLQREPFGLIVQGDPPVVPVSEYRVVGTSTANPRVVPIVTGTARFVGDVRLPGMLHGRVVHPRTLGSTLVEVKADIAQKYPDARLIVRGNLVGVVSPDEWEAICAAQMVAENVAWSDWAGLPRSDRLIEALAETDWSQAPPDASTTDPARVEAAFARAASSLSGYFSLPYYKHAPISPEISVADVRADGTVHLWSSSQRPHALRAKLATMLDTEPENVVVHFADGAGGFGRTNQGDGGSEAEAVLLSQACGHPVRLQWMREEDFGWSTQQAAYLGEVSIALDEAGRMAAVKAEHYHPGVYNDPLLGAALAGLPSRPANWSPSYISIRHVKWPYDDVEDVLDTAYGALPLGENSPIKLGLRHRSMRSPNHLQQNFAVESMINEAAAAAGFDAIQYRLEHTSDPRLVGVLEAVRDLSGWETRPSPGGRRTGSAAAGRGVAVALRGGSYNAAVAEISVDVVTGVVSVERYFLVADVGMVVNPRQLRSNLEGGSVMGISQALYEEVLFDASAVTSTSFKTYRVMEMKEMPTIEIEILSRVDGKVGQGSEPANMLPPVALAGAFFDATGTVMRRLPMRPEYVLAELRDS